jgi:hypothetical protein
LPATVVPQPASTAKGGEESEEKEPEKTRGLTEREDEGAGEAEKANAAEEEKAAEDLKAAEELNAVEEAKVDVGEVGEVEKEVEKGSSPDPEPSSVEIQEAAADVAGAADEQKLQGKKKGRRGRNLCKTSWRRETKRRRP